MCGAQPHLEAAFSRDMRFSHSQSKNGKAQVDKAKINAQQLFSRSFCYTTHTHTPQLCSRSDCCQASPHRPGAALQLARKLLSLSPCPALRPRDQNHR